MTASPVRESIAWQRLVAALSSDIAPYVLAVVVVNLLWIGLVFTH